MQPASDYTKTHILQSLRCAATSARLASSVHADPVALKRGAREEASLDPISAGAESARQQAFELVEATVPSVVLGVATLVGRDAAVDHQHLGRALGLREGDVD